MEALVKTVILVAAKLSKESIGVAKLRLPVLFGLTDLFPQKRDLPILVFKHLL